MAIAKFVAALLLALVALSMLQSMVMAARGHVGREEGPRKRDEPPSPKHKLKHGTCESQCAARCLQRLHAQPKKSCNSSCRTCCQHCRCVPLTVSGSADCPCYREFKINRRPCP